MPNLRIRLKHALARRKRFVTAITEKYTLNLDTQYANDVGQVLGLRKRMERGKWEPEFRKRILPYAAAFFNIATVPAKRHGSKTS